MRRQQGAWLCFAVSLEPMSSRAADSVALGCVALAPHFTSQALRSSEDIFAYDPDLTGCGPDAS